MTTKETTPTETQESARMEKYLFHTKDGKKVFEGTISDFDPEYYGIPSFYAFKNTWKVADMVGMTENDLYAFLEENGYELRDLAYQFNDDKDKEYINNVFKKINLVNKDLSDEEETVYIDVDDFGDVVVTDDRGHVLSTLDELNSDVGSVDIDGDDDSYNWVTSDQLEEEDLEIIMRDASPYKYISDLENIIEDKELADLIFYNEEAFTCRINKYPFHVLKVDAGDIYTVSLKDFIEWSLEEDEDGEIEIDGKKYNIA
ncbi:hypothetical protein GO491_11995 [Flavobacteriaceae bacterium Ap0902]|nr:hypothetical protein [Flavobacteriaceae bacterium Ap0902]